MQIRDALTNIHRDPSWWRKVLLGGALSLTVFGIPWASGLVVESLDNTRKGYPTPLPPKGDPATRYIIGMFAVLVDIVFFVLPPALFGLIIVCAVFGLAVSGSEAVSHAVLIGGGSVLLVYQAMLFALSIAPVARLIYTDEGRAEEAMRAQTVREALRPDRRRAFAQARLQSLVGYVPALLGVVASWLVMDYAPEGTPRTLALLVLIWLTASALLYAHLVVAQLYGAIAPTRG